MNEPPDEPAKAADRHHWSGWPGATCLKCGSDDPMENALADNLWEPDIGKRPGEPGALLWLGTPDQWTALAAAMVCPVKGTLKWEGGKWNLIPPVDA